MTIRIKSLSECEKTTLTKQNNFILMKSKITTLKTKNSKAKHAIKFSISGYNFFLCS